MTKIISELLGAQEPLFSISMVQLERASGQPCADIRLTSDIIAKVHQKTRELGLDPRDTTGPELYQALRNLTRLHDHFLATRMGGEDPNDVADMLPRIQQTVERLNIPRSSWSLKQSVAKRLLKATPPKKLMKSLGYRSVDSMLKREPVAALFGTMRFVESEQWFLGFMAKFNKLHPGDFENSEVEIISLNSKRWKKITGEYVQEKHHNVMQVKELGTVLLLPLPVERLAGVTIVVTSLLLHAINEIRLHSAYFKLQQVRPDFGHLIAQMLTNDVEHHAEVAGHRVHWRVVQRHFSHPEQTHPETFEPHVQAEDLSWRRVEDILYHLEPAMHFWHNMDYVAARGDDGQPISLNLMDMAINYLNQLPYQSRVSGHFKESLASELYGRYLRQPAVESHVLSQFDNSAVQPEVLAMSRHTRTR
jgi:hypothetical protein